MPVIFIVTVFSLIAKIFCSTTEFTYLTGELDGTACYAAYGPTFNPANIMGGRGDGCFLNLRTRNDSIYFIGGYGYTGSGTSSSLDDVWEYSISLNQWRQVQGSMSYGLVETLFSADYHSSNTPGAWLNPICFPTENETEIVVMYGQTPSQGRSSQRWKFSLSLEQWKRILPPGNDFNKGTTGQFNSSVIPPRLYSRNNNYFSLNSTYGFIFGGYCYADGVIAEGFTNDVWLYDKRNDEFSHWWGDSPSLNTALNIVTSNGVFSSSNVMRCSTEHHVWAVERNGGASHSFYIFGGVTTGDVVRNDLHEFDFAKSEWRRLITHTGSETSVQDYEFHALNIPSPFQNGMMWDLGDRYLYMYGGILAPSPQTKATSQLWVYSVDLNQWKFAYGRRGVDQNSISSSNVPGSGTVGGAVVIEERPYLFPAWGKNDIGNGVQKNAIWRYNYYMCHNHLFNTSDGCDGHGKCIGVDLCDCDDGYSGSNCSTVDPVPVDDDYFTLIKGPVDANYPDYDYGCGGEENLPVSRSRASGFYFRNHKVYVFGGQTFIQNSTDHAYLNDVWSFDVLTKDWCFLGGRNGSILPSDNLTSVYSSVMEYDAANSPSGRSTFGSFSTLFSFLVFGGRVASTEKPRTNELWEYSVIGTSRNQWRILMEHNEDSEDKKQPSIRSGVCVGQFGDMSHQVYFFGGEGRHANYSGGEEMVMLNDLWEYDVVQTRFTVLRNATFEDTFEEKVSFVVQDLYNKSVELPVGTNPPRRKHASCWVDKSFNFFVFGGLFPHEHLGNDVWIYNTTTTSWTFIAGGTSDESNQFGADKMQYDGLNVPAVRHGSVMFSNQLQFSTVGENTVFFYGGGTYNLGRIWGDLWAFSSSIGQFKFVNGTSGEFNKVTDTDMIGARAHGVGVTCVNFVLMIIGGEVLEKK